MKHTTPVHEKHLFALVDSSDNPLSFGLMTLTTSKKQFDSSLDVSQNEQIHHYPKTSMLFQLSTSSIRFSKDYQKLAAMNTLFQMR